MGIIETLIRLRQRASLAAPVAPKALLGAFAALLASVAACGDLKTDRTVWREEVQLANGEVVVVNRVAVRDKSGFPIARRGAIREWKVIFPDGRTTWTSGPSDKPIAIELQNGKSYVVVTIRSRELCAKHKDPEGSLLFFRYDGKEWLLISEKEYPGGGEVNLIWNPWGRDSSEDVSGLVKNKDKRLLLQHNPTVGVPLADPKLRRSLDACQMFKKN